MITNLNHHWRCTEQKQNFKRIFVITFWSFKMFQYRSDQPQIKRNVISNIANMVYEFPQELPNDLSLRILEIFSLGFPIIIRDDWKLSNSGKGAYFGFWRKVNIMLKNEVNRSSVRTGVELRLRTFSSEQGNVKMNTVFNLMIIHFHYKHWHDFLSRTNKV